MQKISAFTTRAAENNGAMPRDIGNIISTLTRMRSLLGQKDAPDAKAEKAEPKPRETSKVEQPPENDIKEPLHYPPTENIANLTSGSEKYIEYIRRHELLKKQVGKMRKN